MPQTFSEDSPCWLVWTWTFPSTCVHSGNSSAYRFLVGVLSPVNWITPYTPTHLQLSIQPKTQEYSSVDFWNLFFGKNLFHKLQPPWTLTSISTNQWDTRVCLGSASGLLLGNCLWTESWGDRRAPLICFSPRPQSCDVFCPMPLNSCFRFYPVFYLFSAEGKWYQL